MTRTRIRNSSRAGGTWGRYVWAEDHSEGAPCAMEYSRCDDETLAGDGHPFFVDRKTIMGCLINRPWTGYYTAYFHNWVADAARVVDSVGTSHLTVSGEPSNGESATNAMKRTNPSRPVVDLPISIGELVEIPRLIKEAGDLAFRRMSKLSRANLEFQFVWLPLISDLMKSFEFQSHFANRAKELKRLRKGGRGRTVTVFSGSESSQFNWTLQSSGFGVTVPCTKTTQLTKRVFVPWIPDHDAPETDMEMRKAAIAAVLGLTFDDSTTWNLIPWSWLIDWFSNAGDYFSARRNIVGFSAGACQVMRTTNTQTLVSPMSTGSGSFSGGVCKHITKQRALSSSSFSAQLPFLSARQLSILGSMSVLRRRRGIR